MLLLLLVFDDQWRWQRQVCSSWSGKQAQLCYLDMLEHSIRAFAPLDENRHEMLCVFTFLCMTTVLCDQIHRFFWVFKLRSFLSSSTVFVFYTSVVINVSITFAFDWHVSLLKWICNEYFWFWCSLSKNSLPYKHTNAHSHSRSLSLANEWDI